MRVAVVTPYHLESDEQLDRCMDSVGCQTHGNVTHIMVSDGYPKPWKSRGSGFEHITLPVAHADAGATPRAIGALSAFSRGCDAVAFLDADNWYERNHVELMLSTLASSPSANMAVATRTIYDVNRKELYVDRIESNGENMVDTNCMFITKQMIHLLSHWITPPGYRLVSDKAFWETCKAANVRYARCDTPTVAYVTRWAWHYQQAGVDIPDDAVWMVTDQNNDYKQMKHKDWRNR